MPMSGTVLREELPKKSTWTNSEEAGAGAQLSLSYMSLTGDPSNRQLVLSVELQYQRTPIADKAEGSQGSSKCLNYL